MQEPRQNTVPQNIKWSGKDLVAMSKEIYSLLELGAISACIPCKKQFISTIFLVPKPNGSNRFILNLKNLNKSLKPEHFKLEDIRTVLKLLTPGCFMGTIDLKNAYFLIPITKADKKYLRFEFQGTLYEFNCLPFGLNTAPSVFTKIMKPVVSYLRSLGLISCIYLDDLLCIGKNSSKCYQNINKSVHVLQSLGFVINFEKSSLNPNQTCKYLGFIFNAINMTIELPEAKKKRLYSETNFFINKVKFKIRDFAKLVGLMVSACPAVPYGILYSKNFERYKTMALEQSNGNFNKYMDNNDVIVEDLSWWKNHILNAFNPIRHFQFTLEIFSDASTTGWGLFCSGEKANGFWSLSDRNCHINYLELLAAFIGLKTFASNYHHCEILLRIDSTTAISYINKYGGTRFEHLNNLARQLWQWCEERHIWVFASYIQSKENMDADRESRRSCTETEWELSSDAYNQIIGKFGAPEADLFATRCNAKCSKYISWHRDPDAFAIDAFTINWSNLYFYAFPPFSLVLRTLRKIITDNARSIVVAPYWPTQPWFPMLQHMLDKDNVIILESNPDLLMSPFRERHPLHKSLSLIAGVLSSNPLADEVSQTRQ